MKDHPKHSKSFINVLIKILPTLALYLLISLSILLTFYSLKSIYLFPSSSSSNDNSSIRTSFIGLRSGPSPDLPIIKPEPTELRHLVFGIGAAAKHWARRKEYVKYWWPGANVTRGYVFLDRPVYPTQPDNPSDYPTVKVSGSTGQFPYSYRRGSRSALRITRIVSEMVRTVGESDDVRWFVMGDDDTVFFTDNLIRVLRKYDHKKMYYVGSNSETHMQNINFAYDMAFGGGGFAISYPLAKAIEKMQDRCILRYAPLYGSDDRIHACLAELGVPLTKEPGFHQCDVHGNLFGLLAAHPVAPLVTLHHLDILDPIFPYMTPAQALTRLTTPSKLDSASLMQQSICYDTVRNWTVSVSWGYAVQIIRGLVTPREMQRPARTFFNWYKQDDPSGFSFNTRPFSHHPCQKPYVFYVDNTQIISPDTNVTRSDYLHHQIPHSYCWWDNESPEKIHRVEVYKTVDPHKWDEAPRRDCCRVQDTNNEHVMAIEVGKCGEDEVMEPFQ